MTPDEIEVLKKETSDKINKILSDFSMKINYPIKEVSLNKCCSYFKDKADASYYITIKL